MMDISNGDILVCIDNQQQGNYLTLGRRYKVFTYDDDDDNDGSYVGIIDDCGELYHYRLNRFKLDISYERRYKLEKLKFISNVYK